jgi:putative cell wall-binding protein
VRRFCGFIFMFVLGVLAIPAMAFGQPSASYHNAIAIDGDAGIQAPCSTGMHFSGLSDFSIEMWVKPTACGPGSSTLYRQIGNDGTLQTWLLMRDTGRVEFALDNRGQGWAGIVSDQPLSMTKWTHVAAVKSGANLSIYLDGRLAANGNITPTQSSAGVCDGGITLGRDWLEGNQYHGFMDEVRLFSAAEDSATIRAWRFRGVDTQHPFQSQLRAYFRLDGSGGTDLSDLAGGAGGTVVSSQTTTFIDSMIGLEYQTRQHFPVSGRLPFYEGPAFGAAASIVAQPAHGSVSISDAAWGDFTYTPDAPFLGTDEFTYRYTDADGDSNIATVKVDVITPDTASPETTATFSPSAGWVSVPAVSVSLVASDESEIAGTVYRLGGGSLQTYSTPFDVTAEGTTTVAFRSSDVYGNVEATKTATVRIDRTAPLTTCDARSSYVGTATVHFSAEDTCSGVAETDAMVDGSWTQNPGPVTLGTGMHRITYYSGDAASNWEDSHDITVMVRNFARVAGPTRYETAVEASKRAFPQEAGTVIVATGEKYPDALAGCGLAGVYGAPILLTHRGSLPQCTADEIARLGAKRVVILGSTRAVSAGVETSLAALVQQVDRIGGVDRYETADLIAMRMVQEMGGEGYDGRAFIATGDNYADALAASPIAARMHWPIFLVHSGRDLSASTRSVMTSIGVTDPCMLGSEVVVSPIVARELRAMTRHEARRVSGPTRWETSGQIARFAVDEAGFKWDGLALSTGENYPDALVAGPLQAQANAPLLLTRTDSLTSTSRAVLHDFASQIASVVYVGGKPALSDAADRAVQDTLK